jgi:putative hydrolase of the HAD superfamily
VLSARLRRVGPEPVGFRSQRQQPTWIFDLDNTLHDARPYIFPQINQAMTAYIQQHLGLDYDAACQLRRHYWLRYGATLLGLMKHHGTDPNHFLWHTHQFPRLRQVVVSEPGLRIQVSRLPGRKFIFSNAPKHYVDAVLDVLDIRDLFVAVFGIECVCFRPKPAARGFLQLCRAQHIRMQHCIMVEDTLENLYAAKKLGMRTVWMAQAQRTPGYVDRRISSLSELSLN